jgi:hypothetical protein
MICIYMAASYLAVYYLKTQHPGAHTDPLLNSTHTYIHDCRRQVGSSIL